MTTIALALSVNGTIGTRPFSKSVFWTKTIPDEQVVVPEAHGFSTVFSLKNDVLELSQHAPLLGQVFDEKYSTKGTHTLSKTIDGISFSGTVTIS